MKKLFLVSAVIERMNKDIAWYENEIQSIMEDPGYYQDINLQDDVQCLEKDLHDLYSAVRLVLHYSEVEDDD